MLSLLLILLTVGVAVFIYWTSASTTREEVTIDQLRGGVDSNGYWQPNDTKGEM